MKVKLIAYTPNPDMVVYKAARTCYQAGGIDDIQEPTAEKLDRFIQGLVKSGHTSTLEHAVFTFAVEGVSRVVSHELVRHRIASYSQQSQRYVKYEDGIEFCIPASIAEAPEEQQRLFEKTLRACGECYEQLLAWGFKAEDARYILPNATATQIICTFNARSLLNFFRLRCCRRAQPEMQDLAHEMLQAVREVAPVIFRSAGRQCGSCTEERKCNDGQGV